MSDFAPQHDLETVLENQNWIRELARKLLWDQDMVDDVMQEVWITAIRKGPRQSDALRGWLAGVVRRLSMRANRTRMRRVRREKNALPRDPVLTPSEISERLEIQSRMLEAVSTLEEPYRTVVYGRFFRGLRLVEIAKEQGVDSSTTRTQLARGLERLRGKLDQSYGSRDRWSAILLATVFGGPTGIELAAGTATTATVGALTRSRVVWTVALTTTAFLSWLWLQSEDGALSGAVSRSSAAVEAEAPRAHVESAAAGAAPGSPEATATPPVPVVSPIPRTVPQELESSWVSSGAQAREASASATIAVVSRNDGEPVAGALVYFLGRTEALPLLLGTTSEDGVAAVPAARLARDQIVVVAPGYREYREPLRNREIDGDAGDRHWEVQVEPGDTRTLQFLAAAGEPAAGALVTLRSSWSLPSQPPLALVADRNGAVTFQDRFYHTQLEVSHRDHAIVHRRLLGADQVIQLPAGVDVEGIACRADGDPAAHCEISIETPNRAISTKTMTDERGRFQLGSVAPDVQVSLIFQGPDVPPFRVVGSPRPDELWRIDLPTGRVIQGTVWGPDGRPATGATVLVLARTPRKVQSPGSGPVASVRSQRVGSSERAGYRFAPRHRMRVDTNGEFESQPIAAGDEDLFVLVYHPQWANVTLPWEEAVASGQLEVKLETGGVIRGRVLSPGGEPRSGVLLHLGEVWPHDTEGVVGRTRSGADGFFEFSGVPYSEARLGRESVELFITAFAPDVVLGQRGSSQPLPWPGCVRVRSDDSVELVSGSQDRELPLSVRVCSSESVPQAGWHPFLLFQESGVQRGAVGQGLDRPRYFTEDRVHLDLDRARGLLLVPHQGPWCWVSLAEWDSTQQTLDVLPPQDAVQSELVLVNRHGDAIVQRGVAIEIPGVTAPGFAVAVGVTDSSGGIQLPAMERSTLRWHVARKSVTGDSAVRVAPGDPVRLDAAWQDCGAAQLDEQVRLSCPE